MADGAWLAVIAAAGTALAGVVSAAVTGLVMFLNARHKNKQEAEAAAVGQRDRHIDRLQRQLDQRDKHIVELSEAYEDVSRDAHHCHVDYADLYGITARLHDFCRRAAAALSRGGMDAGEVPDMPPRRERPDRDGAESRRRSLAQSTVLLKEQSGVGKVPPVARPAPPAGGEGGPPT